LIGYLNPRVARALHARDVVAGAKVFRRTVAPVYLRRNQEDVLTELPDKIEVEDWVQFTTHDERAYVNAVRSGNFMAMRQAAYASGVDSAKLARLGDIVGEAAINDWKVIVFSYLRGVLDAIGTTLGPSVAGVLTGSVPARARQNVIAEFSARAGHAVLLSQIEAGGTGLNIQAASIVVLAEPQWKPSTEHQAIARAYRMGQVRKVHVHRLLAKASVDERVREVLERKSKLFDAYARHSDAKESDARAVDGTWHGDEPPIAAQREIIDAERRRLGIST
ncbi:MAG: SWF/SNF helicase family protein, partial [Actinomycetota bacterium]|nr:SWF/SNF helicase family protein [Actinomycetota bacterium]